MCISFTETVTNEHRYELTDQDIDLVLKESGESAIQDVEPDTIFQILRDELVEGIYGGIADTHYVEGLDDAALHTFIYGNPSLVVRCERGGFLYVLRMFAFLIDCEHANHVQ